MKTEILFGVLIPFLGTSAEAACVFFMKKELSRTVQRALTCFASGVMVATSIWSLIIPAMEQSEPMGQSRVPPCGEWFWGWHPVPTAA